MDLTAARLLDKLARIDVRFFTKDHNLIRHPLPSEVSVDNYNFGVALTLVGMGGTLLSLWALTLVIHLLKKVFPRRAEAENSAGQS